MPSAIAQIVDAYVKLRDRPALEELKVHRRKVIETMQALSGPFDATNPIKQNQNELTIIEAGIARLARRDDAELSTSAVATVELDASR